MRKILPTSSIIDTILSSVRDKPGWILMSLSNSQSLKLSKNRYALYNNSLFQISQKRIKIIKIIGASAKTSAYYKNIKQLMAMYSKYLSKALSPSKLKSKFKRGLIHCWNQTQIWIKTLNLIPLVKDMRVSGIIKWHRIFHTQTRTSRKLNPKYSHQMLPSSMIKMMSSYSKFSKFTHLSGRESHLISRKSRPLRLRKDILKSLIKFTQEICPKRVCSNQAGKENPWLSMIISRQEVWADSKIGVQNSLIRRIVSKFPKILLKALPILRVLAHSIARKQLRLNWVLPSTDRNSTHLPTPAMS